ncbi:MAG: hypothetical protein ABIF92_01580, partial [archaeon]
MENDEKKDGLSFDFSKFKKKLKRDKSADDDMAFDLSSVSKWLKGHKKVLIYSMLFLVLLFSAWLRFAPEEKYTGISENSLSAMDPYWHYRHANDVYEHGYVGDELVCYNSKTGDVIRNGGENCLKGYSSVAWDFMHDAPDGGQAAQ